MQQRLVIVIGGKEFLC